MAIAGTIALLERTPHRGMITACIICATLLQSLDQTIANVALPYMQGTFSASYDEITWVLTAYITAAAIQGAGFGLVFTPLQVLAFATLSPSYRTEGAALFSLGRNIGAAIGVSVTTSLLAHNAQVLHEVIGASVNPFNRALHALGSAGKWLDPTQRHGAMMLDQLVTHQAQIIAYINDYVLMIFTTMPALLLLLLMRRPRPAPSAEVVQASE